MIANVIAVPLTALWMCGTAAGDAADPLGLGLERTAAVGQLGLEALLGLARLTSTLEGGVITTRAWPVVSLVLAGRGVDMALLVRPLACSPRAAGASGVARSRPAQPAPC